MVTSGQPRAPRMASGLGTRRLTPCVKRPSKQRVTCVSLRQLLASRVLPSSAILVRYDGTSPDDKCQTGPHHCCACCVTTRRKFSAWAFDTRIITDDTPDAISISVYVKPLLCVLMPVTDRIMIVFVSLRPIARFRVHSIRSGNTVTVALRKYSEVL